MRQRVSSASEDLVEALSWAESTTDQWVVTKTGRGAAAAEEGDVAGLPVDAWVVLTRSSVTGVGKSARLGNYRLNLFSRFG